MLVYRPTSRRVDVATALEELATRVASLGLPRATDHDAVRALLIDAGELEAALVDRESPTQDDTTPLTSALGVLLVSLGDAFVRSWDGGPLARELPSQLLGAIDALGRLAPRDTVDVPIPEGFAFYGLFPETYISAARALVAARAPKTALVIGIRSIGTTLSGIVAATLGAAAVRVERITVRPRGHPFERELRLTERVTRTMRAHAEEPDGVVAIVDEGPGISGSSFGSVADFVSRLGVADDRIVFLPSWGPPASALRNAGARERWRRHARFLGEFDPQWIASGRLATRFDATITADLSAGAWRERSLASPKAYPAIHPQHERRKYLLTRADGDTILIKFEGLGRYGDASADRARRLASAGFGPAVHAHHDGFTATAWMQGTPLRQSEADSQFATRVGRYIGWLSWHERTGCHADPGFLLEMVELNVREGLGPEWIGAVGHALRFAAAVRGAPAVRLDNRMMPHEWLRTADGFIKTDGASHYDDHFYPGPHDIAWDLAGASIELGLDASAERALMDAYIAASNDSAVGLRLPFMRVAYLAFRLGYTSMAAESLGGTDDGTRMRRDVSRYATALREVLSGAASAELEPTGHGQSYATGA